MKSRIVRCAGAVVALAVYSSAGAPVNWATALDGNWNVPANWNPVMVPGLSDSVTLGLAGPYTVSVTADHSAGSIAITNPNAVLDVMGFRTLSLFGSLSNAGTIRVNPTGVGATTSLHFAAAGTLSGPGSVVLPFNGSLSDLSTGAGVVMTQSAGHTIEGRGRVTAGMINNGTVSANVATAAMEISGADKTNNAVMEAVNGATLTVSGVTILQGVNGVLVADGANSFVNIGSATVSGGTVQGINGGRAAVNLDSTMIGVRTLGATQVNGFRTLNIANSLTNDGTLTINPDLVGAGTGINFTDSSSLTGTGSVVLAVNGGLSDVRTSAGAVMTHAPTHTIRGRGRITAAMINNGTVTADDTGAAMEISGSPKVNNATMQSTNGAVLNISNTTVTQNPGGVILATGTDSQTVISGSTVIGGVVRGNSPARVSINSSDSTFDAVRTLGTTEVLGFRTLGVINGLTNDGVMSINPTSIGAATGMRFDDSSSLGGTGRLVLVANSNLSEVRTATGQTMTHAATHTIEGRGRISASMINNGTISANVAGAAMELTAETKTNNATIRAINGATATITTTIEQNTTGRITADGAGSTIRLQGATIDGGVVEGINGGKAEVNGSDSAFVGVRFEGNGDVAGFRTLSISGGLTNNGLIRVNPDLVGAATGLNFDDSSLLGGTGRVELSSVGSLSEIRTAPGQSFTQGPSHVIDGRGRISGAMTNNGTVSANVAGGTLQLTGNPKTNNATMRAVGGGSLELQPFINQGAAGTITGGRLRSLNGGTFVVPSGVSNPTLVGVDSQTTINVFAFRDLGIGPGCVNNGRIVMNPDQVGAAATMRFTGNHTLGGNGVISLATNNTLAVLAGDAGVTLVTLGPGQRLEGIGRVIVPLEMRGTIAPGLSLGTLNATESIEMTPTATFEAEVSAPETADRLASTSEFVADGTLDVRFIDGFNPAGYWGATIVTATQGVSGRFDTILAPVPADSRLAVRARYLPNEIRIGAVCKPDINFDGMLNFFDISAFIALYNVQDPDADIAGPFGVWNFFDIAAYIAQYNGGCP
jgi:hypothetical protein